MVNTFFFSRGSTSYPLNKWRIFGVGGVFGAPYGAPRVASGGLPEQPRALRHGAARQSRPLEQGARRFSIRSSGRCPFRAVSVGRMFRRETRRPGSGENKKNGSCRAKNGKKGGWVGLGSTLSFHVDPKPQLDPPH